MIGEEIKRPDTNQEPTGWESVAELANDEHANFEKACKSGKEQIKLLEEKHIGSDFSQTFSGFIETCHEQSADFINTAVERVTQLSKRNDPEINVLMSTRRAGITGGRWYSRGKIGTGEYIFETLGSKCSPINIGKLTTIMKTIPSSDYARYENMRMDAYRIENVVVNGRSFIHDCAPEAYKLIEAMVDYYDARGDEELVKKKQSELSELLSRLRAEHGAGYTDPHEDYIFDLANYDKPANAYDGDPVGIHRSKRTEAEQIYDGDKSEIKAIDILRRLKKNMEPIPFNAPHTKIPELNDAFAKLEQIPTNNQTGELRVSINDLSEILKIINQHLIENQGQRTLYPSTISAIAYIDKLSTIALKNLSKKDWQSLVFDPTFKEILRFSQLTMSDKYSEEDFEHRYSDYIHKAGETFKEDQINNEKISEAFRLLQSQILKNARAVAGEFSNNQHLKYLANAVWSGNLTHELIGLSERFT